MPSSLSEPTPLWLAVWYNNTSLARLLLDKGADLHIYAKKQSGRLFEHSRKAMSLALAHANVAMIVMLLDHYDKSRYDGDNTLSIAMIAKGNLTLAEKILRTGSIRIDGKYNWLQSPLIVAVAKGREPFVRLVLRYGADANEVAWSHYDYYHPEKPRSGMSMLKYAVKKGAMRTSQTPYGKPVPRNSRCFRLEISIQSVGYMTMLRNIQPPQEKRTKYIRYEENEKYIQ